MSLLNADDKIPVVTVVGVVVSMLTVLTDGVVKGVDVAVVTVDSDTVVPVVVSGVLAVVGDSVVNVVGVGVLSVTNTHKNSVESYMMYIIFCYNIFNSDIRK